MSARSRSDTGNLLKDVKVDVTAILKVRNVVNLIQAAVVGNEAGPSPNSVMAMPVGPIDSGA
jgi:hypothetical protein